MQDRYAGDVGDYIKLALLRALVGDRRRLGVVWYLYPDERHNEDGKHTTYLDHPDQWASLDSELFDALAGIVRRKARSVADLQAVGIPDATYFDVPVPNGRIPPNMRCEARSEWFSGAQVALAGCDLVFADPDNGLTDDQPKRRRRKVFGKQMPLHEAKALAEGRSAIIYHHNSRFRGGHDVEVDHWLSELGNAIAIRANAFSCRTFFVISPDEEIRERSQEFCTKWARHGVRYHQAQSTNEVSGIS